MGRGDKKSRKGKRWKGSFGVSRNKKSIKTRLKRTASKKTESSSAAETAAKTKRTPKKKAEA